MNMQKPHIEKFGLDENSLIMESGKDEKYGNNVLYVCACCLIIIFFVLLLRYDFSTAIFGTFLLFPPLIFVLMVCFSIFRRFKSPKYFAYKRNLLKYSEEAGQNLKLVQQLSEYSYSARGREMIKIVKWYGSLIVEVTGQFKTKYRAFVFPRSLLHPYTKEDITKAVNFVIVRTRNKGIADNLGGNLVFLDRFIDDDEANRINQERILKMNKLE